MTVFASVAVTAAVWGGVGTLAGYLVGVRAGMWVERRWPRRR